MKVTLYRYIGDSDTANKLLKSNTVVYDKEVIPYGSFDPAGATFRLDVLLDVNYAKFTYNSHDYYGYVDVSTDSKGIYSYKITTDPLTTAWYAGCFNTGELCKYSDSGSAELFDDRATFNPDLSYEYFQIKPTSTAFRIILVIARSSQTADTYGNIYNPMYDVYSMSFGDYARFCHAVGSNAYDASRGSVFRFFAVPIDEITSMSTRYTAVTQVELFQPTDETYPTILCPGANPTFPKLSNTFKISMPADGYAYNENWLPIFSVTIDKPINSWRRKNIIKIYVEDMGYISFVYSDVAKGSSITSIGYRKSFDFITGIQRATLVVNHAVLKDYFVQTAIANSIPFYDAEHQKMWNDRFAGSLAAGIGIVSGIMSAPAIPLTASLGLKEAQNIISPLASVHNSSEGRGYTVNGAGAGSIDLPNRQGSFVIWQEAAPRNLADIQGKFGKPDGLVRVVGNLKGWVQTESCHLPSNGLPFDLISQAEKLSDAGFRIEE